MNLSGTLQSDFMKLTNLPNRKKAGLIDFAASDFLSLKQALEDYAKAVYPNDYSYFIESDLGIMFIELIAYMGSVMSMKADMLANENILQTARQRDSVRKLLDLVGVKMKGPLSAAADAAITFSKDPGDVTVEAANRIVNTVSPEDGEALTFTLYKTVNGQIEPLNIANADLQFTPGTGISYYEELAIQEGALATESGTFGVTDGIKTINLGRAPVVDGSIQLYITSTDSDVEGGYTEVENVFFASGSKDRVFEVVYDDDYAASIVFGNGLAGVSPDDAAEFFVTYRVGGGSRGNIAKESIDAAITITSTTGATGTIKNTSLATGGANAETVEKAKKYAPLTFRRQDRIVTLEDYTVFSNSFISTWGTVGKAIAATRKAYASANVIDIYVLEKASDLQLQKATPTFKTSLLTEINKKKMATDEVVIVDGLIRTLDLVATIKIDEEEKNNQTQIINKVRDKILTYMNVDNRDFGQALNLAELNRQIFEVDEVRFSTIDNLEKDVTVDFNEIIQLNNLTINIDLLA
jgi:hypothetical protein